MSDGRIKSDTRGDGCSPDGSSNNRLSRRNILLAGTSFAAAAAIGSGGTIPVALAQQAAAAGGRPNIIFILADDLGWKDVGYHGSDIKTPNIDALAQTGARLEEYYCQQICTPTRAAFMTGRYPIRYGLQMAVIPSAGKYGLATDEWLLPQALK
jgi:hypothetical protein